jgi:hypothetical protein
MRATQISVDDLGNGFCEGTGDPIEGESALLVALAGIAWETGCKFNQFDWDKARLTYFDASEAWELVTSNPLLLVSIKIRSGEHVAVIQEPAQALDRWLAKASDKLKPHSSLIREMGSLLEKQRMLPAERVAVWLDKVTPTEGIG